MNASTHSTPDWTIRSTNPLATISKCSDSRRSPIGETTLFQIELADHALLKLFTGGTRSPRTAGEAAVLIGPDRLLVNIAGNSLVLLDAVEARRIVFPEYNE